MIEKHREVDKFLELQEELTEQLKDPNKDLTTTDIIMGRGKPVKVMTSNEQRDDRTLLGSMYTDKQFLRSEYNETS
jgi:hypothetical protein